MLDEVISRRVAVSTLNGQMQQLLKQSSSELTAEQTDDQAALKDDVQHKLNTVSIALLFTLFISLIYIKHFNPLMPTVAIWIHLQSSLCEIGLSRHL